MRITTLCMSTTIQRTAVFERVNMNEVNRSVRYRLDASGKAVNAARVLNQLEQNCALLICPAGKENIDDFVSLARADALESSIIPVPGRVRVCCTLLEKENGRVTELVMDEPDCPGEQNKMMIVKAEKRIWAELQKALKKSDALLFAGTTPKIWPEDFKVRVCKSTCDAGVVLLVDFWGKELLSVLKECTPDIIKINAKEFCGTFCTQEIRDTPGLMKAVADKSRELNNCIVITRGSESTVGAFRGTAFEAAVEKIKAVNTIGCGDSFSSGFLYEYLKTAAAHSGTPDISAALAKGTWCAARNAECEKVGTLYE
ncbi:hypothetical protein H0R92_05085 [Treponema sp. OMZ 840]|uniref:PfkB family carbohydrate kinase n=1 Tax=Treponema sp. OMZ 840 TaxID=244313 RepID=UPI003D8F8956